MRRDDRWSYPVLLGAYVALLVVHPFMADASWARLVYDAMYSVVLIATVHALHDRWNSRLIALTLCVPTAALRWSGYLVPAEAMAAVLLMDSLFSVAFFAYTAAVIVRAILAGRAASNPIAAAFGAYLMLGLAWAGVYSAVELLWPGSFRMSADLEQAIADPDRRMSVFTYFSFVTLTTVGYGDIVPVKLQAGTLAWVEAMFGQFYIAVFVAGLVGLRIARQPPLRPPPDAAPPGR